jgi:hypothetical protein
VPLPEFVAAGSGAPGLGAGTIQPAYPPTAPGDALFLHACQFLEVTPVPAPAGWTELFADTVGAFKQYVFLRDARANGSESGSVSVSVDCNASAAIIYGIRNVEPGAPESPDIIAGAGGVCGGPAITTADVDRLALGFYSTAEFAAGEASANVGSIGGTWAEVSEYRDAVVSQLAIQLQTADMPLAGTISGGVSPMNSLGVGSVCRGFALVFGLPPVHRDADSTSLFHVSSRPSEYLAKAIF